MCARFQNLAAVQGGRQCANLNAILICQDTETIHTGKKYIFLIYEIHKIHGFKLLILSGFWLNIIILVKSQIKLS